MSIYQAWTRQAISESLYTESITSTGQVVSKPAILFFGVFTHHGGQEAVGSGAVVEIFDGSKKIMHLESASGDRAPFGFSLVKPILCATGISINYTATGFNGSLGYYHQSV